MCAARLVAWSLIAGHRALLVGDELQLRAVFTLPNLGKIGITAVVTPPGSNRIASRLISNDFTVVIAFALVTGTVSPRN
jgi:hypothetical protein